MSNQDTVIYLAITKAKQRLVITGSFELYSEFMRASLPQIVGDLTPVQSCLDNSQIHNDQKGINHDAYHKTQP